MRLAVFGTGGVGGYFGGRLAACGADVSFVARGAHLNALQRNGLRIQSPLGDVHVPAVNATDNPASIGRADVVFFTVKLYDTESAIAELKPLIGPKTVVVPLQNGVDSVGTLTRTIGAEHVAGGTCYLAAVISEPGVIRHTAMNRMIFGTPGNNANVSAVLKELLAACANSGFEAVMSPDIRVDIWAKFVRLTVFSGMTAVTRCPIGVIRDNLSLSEMARGALKESMAVALAKGVPLTDALIDEVQVATAALPYNARSSMLEDLERGRRLELPWLSGAVVRIGNELGVPTPIHQFITTILSPHVNGAAAR
jgi:2-dehydropantoate 2-reductase